MEGLPFGNVTVRTDPMDIEILADPLLGKVFYNLFDNALRYGGKGMTEIHVSSSMQDGARVLVVSDNGEGISHEDKQRVFSKGYGRNTGLGLFLTKEILSLTGITIQETGEPGSGARFEIRVPSDKFRFTRP